MEQQVFSLIHKENNSIVAVEAGTIEACFELAAKSRGLRSGNELSGNITTFNAGLLLSIPIVLAVPAENPQTW